ncbi:recombination regulator RecX [Heyndrickxia ginsengihumi]|uniref:recombination regulator RecX n=2 Tax=Heyndrickxia ginsengihumi TaxID=363870 RepID=UPI001DDAF537|nr:recombination regulator RecX [Heyndrickxia ginsengihumi]MBE6184170.1 recombination regulator RecX [Bacillus sp. (in: firmicutes)]MCM3024507.1 recombination regulator RecX [Heyndrickxia ginsengihumi]
MPTITKISVQKNNPERYNIFLDGQYRFSVDEEVLARFQLLKGKEISSFELDHIMLQDDIRKGVNIAIQFLSFRMRSEKEIKDYLRKKEMDEAIIKEVIHKLYEQQYLNDLHFAISYVKTQVNTTRKGAKIIQLELQQKGINEAYIEEAMGYYDIDKQVEHALLLAEKYAKQHQKLSEKQLYQRIEQHLARKGYTFDVISRALKNLHVEKDEDEEWFALIRQAEKAHKRYQAFTGFLYEQKMKQSLYRKGFSLELIERYLREKEEQIEMGE